MANTASMRYARYALNLSSLLVRLPNEYVGSTFFADPEADVYSIGFLTEAEARHPRPDVLYFCKSGELPHKLDEDAFINCVIISTAAGDTAHLAKNNYNVVMLSDKADPFACYNILQGYFMEDMEVTDLVRRLMAAHFSNRGLQYLIEEASAALGNPVVVVDSNYHYIAHDLGDLEQDESQFATIMRQEMAYESILEPGVEHIRRSKIDSELARGRGPVTRFNSLLGCNTITGTVMVRGICIAHVMTIDRWRPFTKVDEEVFARLTLFVGQEMQKTALYEADSGQMHSYFLTELLQDEQPSKAVIERRLKVLNFHPQPLLYVMALKPHAETLTASDAAHVLEQLPWLRHHGLQARYEGCLVVLHSRKPDSPLSDEQMEGLRATAELNHLSVGISNPFTDMSDVRTHYGQACSAIESGLLIKHALDDRSVYQYRHYAYVELLGHASRHQSLINLCHPALLDLLHHDEEHDSELMETLFAYLQCSGSTRRASKMLHLHKNTLLYRLGRIRQVMGCDLGSGEERFILQLSFRVLLYLGLFEPRVTIVRDDLKERSAQ